MRYGRKVGIIESMILPVYVPDWQIGDGDIEHPYIGMVLSHVLLLETDSHHSEQDPEQEQSYGKFGQEVTVTGVAEPLDAQSVYAIGAFPTAIRGEGFVLYWDAPAFTEGPVTLNGIIDATDYGRTPEGFPEVTGVVTSMELATLLYANEDGGGMNWAPTPGHDQQFRPISSYPRYVPGAGEAGAGTGSSPHLVTTGVVLHLDISAMEPEPAADTTDATQADAAGGSIMTIRLFPDYADTVLWLHGPVTYADAKLSPALVADMEAWEGSYYASLDGNQAWKSRSGAAQFTATGSELAQRLAKELGDGFVVEFHSYEPGSSRQLFRSEQHSRNPAAAEAFRAMVAAEQELKARLEADQGGGVGWFAYGPLSGAVIDPNQHYPGHQLNPVQQENPETGL
ncbi:hypothetical protein NHF46_14175 [Arthrobacter alpinus]|nr:hypothetical protein [Arthrobacter alpinus]